MTAAATTPASAAGGRRWRWNPLTLVRRRFERWWQSRLPRTDQWRLTQRNVYILPTRPGLMLALTLLVLLIASINYQLNLGYLMTFLLAGSAAVGMHVCHGTLRGLLLRLTPPQPVFLGQPVPLSVTLVNERRSPRHGIGLAALAPTDPGSVAPPYEPPSSRGDAGDPWVWADVPAQGSATVQVAFRPLRRGLQPVPALTAETRFPLGTFRVWTIWRPAAQVLVYPRPELHPPPLPPGEPRAGTGLRTRSTGSGEFDGVRSYRRGDPLKQVVWKKAAKSGELVSRDSEQAQRTELWLDHARCGARDVEARLSRLTAWVLLADRLGQDYGLRLPALEIAPASGEAHRRRCLEALALC